jgi:hypothetical protein
MRVESFTDTHHQRGAAIGRRMRNTFLPPTR